METKVCSRCKKEKRVDAFYIDRSVKSGFKSECKFCSKQYKKHKDKICGIYKITSPSGKIYIGQSKNIEERWKQYKNYTSGNKSQVILCRSFEKYGVEEHTFEILEKCENKDLNCRERYWQDFYDVLGGDGLNCIIQSCEDMSSEISEKTRKKMSKARKGKTLSESHRENISKRNKGENNPMYGLKGENHPAFGFKMSDESKKKMLANRYMPKGKDSPLYCGGQYNAKLILDLNTGVFYYCVGELAELYNYNYRTLYNQLKGYKRNKTQFIFA